MPDGLVDQHEYRLWPGPAPGATGDGPEDIPLVQAFVPHGPNAKNAGAIIVCPGGGYGFLAPHEAAPVGQWLAGEGIAAFVLRYRLGPKYHHPVELTDAQRALRFVRHHSANFAIAPRKIGILGFSAGGHLASTASTHWDHGDPVAADPIDQASCRPDLSVLVYPVISLGQHTHSDSCRNLLGENPDPALLELLSNERHVTPQTPPAFLVHSLQDESVPAWHSDVYAGAQEKAGIGWSYVRGDYGGHGFGLQDFWCKPCLQWLREKGW